MNFPTRAASNIAPRALKEAQRQAALTAQRMILLYQKDQLKSWDDLERLFNITVNKSNPFNYANLSLFATTWRNTAEHRLLKSQETPKETEKILVAKDGCTTFGEITLLPEQEGVFRRIRDELLIKKTIFAALNNGHMGTGKTYLGAALIADQIFNQKILEDPINSLRPHPFMIFCPKRVMTTWKRVLEQFGLGEYVETRKIFVFSNGEFSTSTIETLCPEIEDDITEERSLKWNVAYKPIFAILDECHNYTRNSKRTRRINALLEGNPPTRALFLSATPAEKVNDMRTFVLGLRTFTYGDVKITSDTFNYFAKLVDREPEKPNLEAMKRLGKILSPYIFPFPYIKPKSKSINLVWRVDFWSERDRETYARAYADYLEACAKAGKNTAFGRFQKFVALNVYRKTVEPLRAEPIAARIADNYKSGKLATGVGTAYIETVSDIMFILSDKYSIPREHVSIIWGGKRNFKPEDLLTKEQIGEVLRKGLDALYKDPETVRKIKLSLKYSQDAVFHGESTEEQAERYRKLSALKLLGKQSDNGQQIEIDNFQDGTTRIVLFTLASGGVGLSLDQDKPSLLPREGIFTPVYNGKEFQQALGRFIRRLTLSDVYQYVCMMNGTVETEHVAPILDNKLRCSAAFCNRSLSLVDLLEKGAGPAPAETKFRDIEEAKKDAESDDTAIADFVKPEEDDDENNEVEDIEEILIT